MGEEVPDEIGAAINPGCSIRIRSSRCSMRSSHGHRVESGDKIGKTIIFANSQDHAEFIEKVFNEQYPEHRGIRAHHFLQGPKVCPRPD
ncbi:MAG: hypothetical protein IPM82_05595 [Saprospiraceae bacterium]|nr:hypothetical protein [Saprospiraceae bacterium]